MSSPSAVATSNGGEEWNDDNCSAAYSAQVCCRSSTGYPDSSLLRGLARRPRNFFNGAPRADQFIQEINSQSSIEEILWLTISEEWEMIRSHK